jgi:hypothetical protein
MRKGELKERRKKLSIRQLYYSTIVLIHKRFWRKTQYFKVSNVCSDENMCNFTREKTVHIRKR